ncbi:MAG: InlB B-repeat-containing protein, partial [Treponema sp.]|nr:InlB B-repeat-containing protein [Treponema sp.]
MKRSFSILLFFSAIVFLTACKGTSSQTSYTVSFHLNGGSGSVESQTIIEGECATEPSTIPTKNGYEFNFWGLKTGSEATAFNFSTPIYANTKLYANWITIYTVTFNVNGGSGTVASQTVTSGGSATAPATSPTRSGYNFSFWSTSNTSGATAFDFSSAITADTTLYAIWTQTASEEDSGSSGTQENELEEDSETSGNDNQQVTSYTVTFNVNGGSGTVASQTVTSGGSATAPATSPTRSGYSFSFWSTSNASGATAFDFSSAITADTTLYAIWTQVTYTVTFNVNGGTGTVASQTITSGGSATAPTTNPTRTGYTFSFWSTSNASGATAFDFSSAITANTTLYAIWTSDG